MFTRIIYIAIISVVLAAQGVLAQEETTSVSESNLTGAALPAGAVRVNEQSVPAEIDQALQKLVDAGEGKIKRGDSEVLAWTNADYKKSNVPALIQKLTGNLETSGWSYEAGDKKEDLTVFTLLRTSPEKRGLLGFYTFSDEALVVAWTEILSNDPEVKADSDSANPASSGSTVDSEKTELPDVVTGTVTKSSVVQVLKNGGGIRDLTGKWERKTSGMSSYSGGTYQGSSGNYESYTFYADGRVEYMTLVAVQNYGCRLEAFGQNKGSASVSGTKLNIHFNAGTVRRDDSCSPSKNYTNPTKASDNNFDWRIEKDEYGNIQLALKQSDGNVYYYRQAK